MSNNNNPLKVQLPNFNWNIGDVPQEQSSGFDPNAFASNFQNMQGQQDNSFFSKMGNMGNMAQTAGKGFNWKIPGGGSGGTGGGGGGPLGGLSGFMEHAATPLGIGMSLASSVIGFRKARKAERKAKKRAEASDRERERQEEAYRSLDTSNPYLNMENTMEDLTINQKQSQFQKEQFQQSQANILDSLKGAAGGSGVAALAQQMAQSGQLASQQASADIGRQEQQNQMLKAREAGQIQNIEREGDVYSRGLKKEQTETLFGMAQQKSAADQTAVAQAKQAKMDAITGGITGAVDMFAGFGQ
tara:strand:- start:9028 stop:9930 length:903 start_codon:yes stop_codon:yes gene_type:complete